MASNLPLNRRFIMLCVGFCLGLLATGVLSRPSVAPEEITQAEQAPELAIQGYDPVAYFEQRRPLMGSDAIAIEWKGQVWLFASEHNRNLFRTNPARYTPRYLGNSAYAAAHGYREKGDPDLWRIVDGRLYLNHDYTAHAEWQRSAQSHIVMADKNWPAIQAE